MRPVRLAVVPLVILTAPLLADGTPLIERRFRFTLAGEAVLTLKAMAPGTSWAVSGREAAVLTLVVDGHYSQDVILFGGARLTTYRVVLGRLPPGWHSLVVELNKQLSSKPAAEIKIVEATVACVPPSNPAYDAVASAPMLYVRPGSISRFSDIPLLMYYETERNGRMTTIRYSAIFSNEDGGTRTAALMARWGRATDIEWVYEIKKDASGQPVRETFQGTNHRVLTFSGRKEADHPLLLVASDNNNFSDKADSSIRIALLPVPARLSRHSREEIMDRFPWSYRIMAEELTREGKVADGVEPASAVSERDADLDRISDPRTYLYIEAACRQKGTALSFLVKLRGDPAWYSSDLGQSRLRVDRSGYFRVAVRLPVGARLSQVEKLAVRCEPANDLPARPALLTAVSEVFMLDRRFVPSRSLFSVRVAIRLEVGRVTTVSSRS